MFEERTDLLREHIAYLEGILAEEPDEEEKVDVDELESYLNTCQEDIDALKADLPYDEIDDDDIPIEDFDGDELEESEIEDEVVEAENVIDELKQLIADVRDRFFEEEDKPCRPVITIPLPDNLTKNQFYQRLEEWVTNKIKELCVAKQITMTDEEVKNLCLIEIEHAKTDHSNPYPQFSIGLFHVTLIMVNMYKLVGKLMNFDSDLKYALKDWEDLM